MLILVTGATGFIGNQLIPPLLQRGYRVRALAREPSRLAARPWARATEIVGGDVNTAFAVYSDHPLLGVGLGNYVYYFEENLPDTSLAETPEILRIVTPGPGRNRLITPKNFYYRLLSETGVIGLAAFLAFVTAVLGCALYLWLSPVREEKYWGTAGLLGMFAFTFAAISFDSFALPNMWVVFGLITASTWVFFRQPDHPQILIQPIGEAKTEDIYE